MTRTTERVMLREFEATDYADVVALWKRAGLQIRPGDDEESVKRKLRRDPELFLVATHKREIIGSVMGGWDGRRGWVYHLAVDANYRRRGVGAMLITELERRMRRKHVAKLNALVYKTNMMSLVFFRKVRYKEEKGLTLVSKILQQKRKTRPAYA